MNKEWLQDSLRDLLRYSVAMAVVVEKSEVVVAAKKVARRPRVTTTFPDAWRVPEMAMAVKNYENTAAD